MEHIVVAVRPGQGSGVVSWALRHARANGGALEIIASGLEWPDPHGALLRVGHQLIADGCDVPFAMRSVSVGTPLGLAHSTTGVDLIVLGWRSDQPSRTEAASCVAIAIASACPVVIVPVDWRAEPDDGSVLGSEAFAASGHRGALVERICGATAPIRIVPTSFIDAVREPVSG